MPLTRLYFVEIENTFGIKWCSLCRVLWKTYVTLKWGGSGKCWRHQGGGGGGGVAQCRQGEGKICQNLANVICERSLLGVVHKWHHPKKSIFTPLRHHDSTPPLNKNDVIMTWPPLPRTFIFLQFMLFKIDINVITGDYRGEGVKRLIFWLRKVWTVPYLF